MQQETAQELKRLVRLQAVELERARLSAALKTLPTEIATVDNLLKAAQKQTADAQAGLRREELLRSSQELEIAGHKAKASRHRTQMDNATNAAQAAALDHEISFAEKEIARLEDAELASMERTESLEAELARSQALAGRLSETLGLVTARVGEQQLEFTEQLTALAAEREALRGELAGFNDGRWLAHFDRVAKKAATGIANANGQQCAGCRMGIRQQMWNQLRDGELIPCESCGRILYFDPSMVPEPSRPKTAINADAALGGTSIRRSN